MHTTYTLERSRGVVGVGRQTTCTRSTVNTDSITIAIQRGRGNSLRKRYINILEVP